MERVVVLSGGVGGARFVRALVDVVGSDRLTVIGNVGDDEEFYGLHVSPDLDSLVYALAGVHDEQRGWGRRRETWNALDTAKALGDDETWFQLGDRDLGLHLVRTKALRAGEPLSVVTARIAAAFGVAVRVLPATDHRLRTIVETAAGDLSLQEWFVGRRAPRQGRRAALRGRRLRQAGARVLAGARGGVGGRDRARATRTSASGRSSRCKAIRLRGASARATPVVGGQPGDRREGGEGACRPDAAAARGRYVAGARRGLLPRPARRARDRPGRRGRGEEGPGDRGPAVRHADADARPPRRAPARRGRTGGGPRGVART